MVFITSSIRVPVIHPCVQDIGRGEALSKMVPVAEDPAEQTEGSVRDVILIVLEI